MKLRNELNAQLYRQKAELDSVAVSPAYDERFSAVSRGDLETVREQLRAGSLALFSGERVLSGDVFKNAVFHMVLAASAAALACIEAGMGRTEAHILSDLFIRRTDTCMTTGDVCNLFGDMCLDFAERMQEIRKEAVVSLHIRRCIDYIYENLGADLSVQALAKQAGLTPAYLSKLFQNETGISLKRFVKMARVDTAQNLLRYSDLSYLVISTSLGFSTQSVFIAVFKEITGITPGAYRKKYCYR